MAKDSAAPKSGALDFATRNTWGDELSEEERAECVSTLRELVEAFGPAEIMRTITNMGLPNDPSPL